MKRLTSISRHRPRRRACLPSASRLPPASDSASGKLAAGSAAVSGCTSSALTATRNVNNSGNVTQVNVLSVPQACAGETLAVTLENSSHASLGAASTTSARAPAAAPSPSPASAPSPPRASPPTPSPSRNRRRCAASASRLSVSPPRSWSDRSPSPASPTPRASGSPRSKLHAWSQTLTKGTLQPDVRRRPTTRTSSRRTRTSTAGGTETTLTIKPNAGIAGVRLHPLRPQRLQPPDDRRRRQRVLTVNVTATAAPTRSRVFPSPRAGARRPLTWNGVQRPHDRLDRDRDLLGARPARRP